MRVAPEIQSWGEGPTSRENPRELSTSHAYHGDNQQDVHRYSTGTKNHCPADNTPLIMTHLSGLPVSLYLPQREDVKGLICYHS